MLDMSIRPMVAAYNLHIAQADKEKAADREGLQRTWIWEFVLKHCTHGWIIKEMVNTLPFPNDDVNLKRMFLLRALSLQLSIGVIDDTTLNILQGLANICKAGDCMHRGNDNSSKLQHRQGMDGKVRWMPLRRSARNAGGRVSSSPELKRTLPKSLKSMRGSMFSHKARREDEEDTEFSSDRVVGWICGSLQPSTSGQMCSACFRHSPQQDLQLAVMVELAVQHLREENYDHKKFEQELERHWGESAEDTEEHVFEGFDFLRKMSKIKCELWLLRGVPEKQIQVTHKYNREDVQRQLNAFVDQAWKDTGTTFLERVEEDVLAGIYYPANQTNVRTERTTVAAYEMDRVDHDLYDHEKGNEPSKNLDSVSRSVRGPPSRKCSRPLKVRRTSRRNYQPLKLYNEDDAQEEPCSKGGLASGYDALKSTEAVKSTSNQDTSVCANQGISSGLELRNDLEVRRQSSAIETVACHRAAEEQKSKQLEDAGYCDKDGSACQTGALPASNCTEPELETAANPRECADPSNIPTVSFQGACSQTEGEEGISEIFKELESSSPHEQEEPPRASLHLPAQDSVNVQVIVEHPPWTKLGAPGIKIVEDFQPGKIRKQENQGVMLENCVAVEGEKDAHATEAAKNSVIRTTEIHEAQHNLQETQAHLDAVVKDPLPEILSRQTTGKHHSFMNRDDTARTHEWGEDEDMEESNPYSPSTSRRVRLPTIPAGPRFSPILGKQNAPATSASARLKRRKPNRWSDIEVAVLKKEVAKYGKGRWKLILETNLEVLHGRTEVDLKDKWRNLERFEGLSAP